MSDKYKQLDNAVKDLLAELRIDEKSLEVMANGYSPDYPGVTDLTKGENKVQLSPVVAQKIMDSIEK